MDNPQAFPIAYKVNKTIHVDDGMTLLEYYAGQALVGAMSRSIRPDDETIAFECYEMGKLMLKARTKYIKDTK